VVEWLAPYDDGAPTSPGNGPDGGRREPPGRTTVRNRANEPGIFNHGDISWHSVGVFRHWRIGIAR
jgi:hypothetical protein